MKNELTQKTTKKKLMLKKGKKMKKNATRIYLTCCRFVGVLMKILTSFSLLLLVKLQWKIRRIFGFECKKNVNLFNILVFCKISKTTEIFGDVL